MNTNTRQPMMFYSRQEAVSWAYANYVDAIPHKRHGGKWTLVFAHEPSGMMAIINTDNTATLLEDW